ncbi:hypothetical protein M413DRAFT_27370 [Hebeloma cylindrosporum]|uniref:Peptidase C14 caspase domain-containing protein n=1 Tax=Hebeloma cylindrosporum TaxID=76867 RepID=A0A0C2YL93_HEBCY|nr:hypothetical protein M413DRAFT_27370 [Hebeloma cylindrosporum h7]
MLQVPRDQVSLITDEAASRAGIISALDAIRSDDRIQQGDPIFIYYAGHGSSVPPPANWECGGPGRNIQVLVPQDFNPEHGIHGIQDYFLGWSIHMIAEEKGDNITVVLDCCHSGSGTRSDSSTRIRGVELEPGTDLWDLESRAHPFSLDSHVLIAACGESELAKEVNGEGAFTKAFLELFRAVPIEDLTYRDIATYINLPGQNPQIEGVNQYRYIFNSEASSSACQLYLARRDFDSDLVVLNAGTAHGVTPGAEFVIFAGNDSHPSRTPLATFIVYKSTSFFSILRPTSDVSCQSSDLPKVFTIFQEKPGQGGTLRLYLPTESILIHDIRHSVHNVEFVDSRDDAHLEITSQDNQVVVSVRDKKATACGFEHKISITRPNLTAFLEKAECFYRERDHQADIDLGVVNFVTLEFYKLGATHSRFRNIPECHLGALGPNLYSADRKTIEFIVEEGCHYGVKLTNSCPRDLYPSVLYFDNNLNDLIIKHYYGAPFGGSNIPEGPLKGDGGTLTIGYGTVFTNIASPGIVESQQDGMALDKVHISSSVKSLYLDFSASCKGVN